MVQGRVVALSPVDKPKARRFFCDVVEAEARPALGLAPRAGREVPRKVGLSPCQIPPRPISKGRATCCSGAGGQWADADSAQPGPPWLFRGDTRGHFLHLSIFVVVTTHSSKGVFPLSTYLGFCVHHPDLRGVQWNLGTQVVGLLLYRTVPGEPVRPLMEMKGLCKGEVREGTMSTPNASTKYFIMIGY